MPVRIQRSRARGWRMPAGAVYVGRPTRWGNPFRVGPAIVCDLVRYPEITPQSAVDLYRKRMTLAFEQWPSLRKALEELRGRDLVCWCRLDQPCHADVLLELANRPVDEALRP